MTKTIDKPLSDILFERAIIQENGCWEYSGSKNQNGYGVLTYRNVPNTTHRIAYDLCVGDIPKGAHVLHTCDNRACCNPEHLFLGTQQDNMDDMRSKGREPKPVGVANGRAKLKDSDIPEIRQKIALGLRCSDLAMEYKVGWSTINRIKQGTHWRHVP